MDFTYLSKIESELVAPPSEDKIRALATALSRDGHDLQVLLDLAHQSSKIPAEDVKAAIIRSPEIGALLRRVKQRPLSSDEAAQIRRIAERAKDLPVQEGQAGDSDAS
jgi:transcriptional regulator with XRE-family HTH domain